MNILYIFNYLLFINNVFVNSLQFNFNNILQIKKYNINDYILKNDLQKLSLLSKLIYDYDFVGDHTIKDNYIINNNVKNNLTIDFIQKNNIYFNLIQFITFLNNKDFLKNTDKYFNILNKKFPNTQIYGYFYNKNRLHSLILLNHKYKEIIVVFRGSQYIEEWFKNLFLCEKEISFNKNFKIHGGIYNMYTNDDIDKNIVYILENLFKYYPKYRKIFTGHSKGSTNSILLGSELLSKFNKKYNYEIYTFGSPQIFNYKFALYLHNNKNIKIYNVINDLDIVTSLPLINKYHIGTEILLKNNDIIIKKHDEPYKINFNIKKFYLSILNHNLNIYIDNIYNNLI
jgi:hypothetical protein